MEHFYRATTGPWLDGEQWAPLPASVRRSSLLRTLTEIFEHAATASREGGLDNPETHVSRVELALDEEGSSQITALLAATVETALRIRAESATRHLKAGLDGPPMITTELALVQFRQADSDTPEPFS